jgi:hypothetical protein
VALELIIELGGLLIGYIDVVGEHTCSCMYTSIQWRTHKKTCGWAHTQKVVAPLVEKRPSIELSGIEGVRVLQSTNEQDCEAMPRRNIPPVEPSRHQAAAPAVAPRSQVVEPINGELRHGLAQNRVDSACARRDARHFEEEAELEAFGNGRHGLCGAECFSFLICSTPLPKGIKTQRRCSQVQWAAGPSNMTRRLHHRRHH